MHIETDDQKTINNNTKVVVEDPMKHILRNVRVRDRTEYVIRWCGKILNADSVEPLHRIFQHFIALYWI